MLLKSFVKLQRRQSKNSMVFAAMSLNKKLSALAITCLAVTIIFPHEVLAAASSAQNCVIGSSCTIGEFLLDDSSKSITNALCTITSNYPDGTNFLNSVSLNSGADGWYYYKFQTPDTEGKYNTKLSCTVSGVSQTTDKSFVSKQDSSSFSVNSISSAFLSYSSKVVTSFENIV